MSDNGTATTPDTLESFLIADCGHTYTTVVLFDLVEGVYRFITRATTPTTRGTPQNDLLIGIRRAIQQISETTGRPLLGQGGKLIRPVREADGAGVDQFALTVSAADPLQVLLVGLLDDVSIASARRVLQNSYAQEKELFNLADQRSLQKRVELIHRHKPDLIFIAGGTDGGADERVLKLVEMVGIGVRQLPKGQTHVLYAGNAVLREAAKEIISDHAPFHTVENVRPSLETENLVNARLEVERLFQETKIKMLPGLGEALEWSHYPPLSTARAFVNVAQYFAAITHGRVLGIDLGSDTTTFLSATESAAQLMVRTNWGTGRPIRNVLDQIDLDDINRWLPVEAEPEALCTEIKTYLYNKALHPQTIPMTEEELQTSQAIVRELMRAVLHAAAQEWEWVNEQTPDFSVLLVRGRTLVHLPRPGQTILMLLDALQPTGMFALAMDKYGVLPALGFLAQHQPLAAVQALEGGALVDLGWAIVVTGRGKAGQKVLTVQIESTHTGTLEIEVMWGTLELLPLPANTEATLTLKPRRGFDVGFGRGKKKTVKVHGGEVGLVIDARGRPLTWPDDEAEQRETVRQWLRDMGG